MKNQGIPFLFAAALSLNCHLLAQLPSGWKSHDMARPTPPVVQPAQLSLPVPPPSDAQVIFDGKDLSQWQHRDGRAAGWKVENGYMEVAAGEEDIWSKAVFGDVQLHVEWSTPRSERVGQAMGNSGVYLMGLYEVQVLNSYRSETYADGQAGAIYGQFPPLVNASLPPETWQSYDIVFRRPRFDPNGEVLQPARVTLFHNGVLAQDSVELAGPTDWLHPRPYTSHADQLPLRLQDHGSPSRFRNIWVRRLREHTEPGSNQAASRTLTLSGEELARYTGKYELEPRGELVIRVEDGILVAELRDPKRPKPKRLELIPRSRREFELRWTAAKLVFDLPGDGHATGATFHIGAQQRWLRRKP